MAGDIVSAVIQGKMCRCELCGLTESGKWNIITNHGMTATISQSQVKNINKNINYYNIRISGCRRTIKALQQYELELETMKIELMKKEGIDENDKRYRVTF